MNATAPLSEKKAEFGFWLIFGGCVALAAMAAVLLVATAADRQRASLEWIYAPTGLTINDGGLPDWHPETVALWLRTDEFWGKYMVLQKPQLAGNWIKIRDAMKATPRLAQRDNGSPVAIIDLVLSDGDKTIFAKMRAGLIQFHKDQEDRIFSRAVSDFQPGDVRLDELMKHKTKSPKVPDIQIVTK